VSHLTWERRWDLPNTETGATNLNQLALRAWLAWYGLVWNIPLPFPFFYLFHLELGHSHVLGEARKWWHRKGITEPDYSLGTRRGPIDFYQPDLQLLIHHEVKTKELETLVVKMLCADCRLYAHKAASVKGKTKTQD